MDESPFNAVYADEDEKELESILTNCVCPNCGCSDPNLVHLVVTDDGELVLNVCSDCNYSFGLEDSNDSSEFRKVLEKQGVIRTLLSPCNECGNENIDRFIYLGPDDSGQDRIECMNCKNCLMANINISYFEDIDCDTDSSVSSSYTGHERNNHNVNYTDSDNCSDSDFKKPFSLSYFFCDVCQNEDPGYWTEFGHKRVKCLKCQTKFSIPEFMDEILDGSAAIQSSSINVQEPLLKGNISSRANDAGITMSTRNSDTKCHARNKRRSCKDNTTENSKNNKSSSTSNLSCNENASVSHIPNLPINCSDESLETSSVSKLKEMFENGFDEDNLKQNKRHSMMTIPRSDTELRHATSVRSEVAGSTLRYCASNPNLLNISHDVKPEIFDFNKIRSVFEEVPTEDSGRKPGLPKRRIKQGLTRTAEDSCEQKYSKTRQITEPEKGTSVSTNNSLKKATKRRAVIASSPHQSTKNNLCKNQSSTTVSNNYPETFAETGPKTVKMIKSKKRVQEQASHFDDEKNTRQRKPIKTVAEPEPDPPSNFDADHQPTKRVQNQERDKSKNNGKLGQTLITSLDMLKPGDHICWHRDYIVYHHAIVDKVQDNSLLVFENIGHIVPQKGKFAKVEKNKYNFKKSGDMLYRVDYDQSVILSVDETLAKANSRINEAKYNFFTNNCEHFATWCKTGKAKSGQVDTLVGRLGLMASEMGVKVGEEGVKIGAKLLVQGAPSLDLIKNVGLRNGLKIIEDVAVGSVNGGLIALGIGINLAVDVSSFAYHTYQAYREYKKGKISRQDFKRKRMKIGGECLGRFIGSSTLGIVGNFICPVIGGVIGATLGGFIGRLIGAALGKKLSERCYKKI